MRSYLQSRSLPRQAAPLTEIQPPIEPRVRPNRYRKISEITRTQVYLLLDQSGGEVCTPSLHSQSVLLYRSFRPTGRSAPPRAEIQTSHNCISPVDQAGAAVGRAPLQLDGRSEKNLTTLASGRGDCCPVLRCTLGMVVHVQSSIFSRNEQKGRPKGLFR